MDFAIVRFIDEDGAPGIISTNWIVDSKTCKYPNVKMEYTKNKMLLSRCVPLDDWITCPIKILKEFPSYQLAKNRLSDAEDTSALESCNEDEDAMKRRIRRKKTIHLPGEDFSNDDEDYDTSTSSKRNKIIAYPLPPPATPTSTKTAYTPTPTQSTPQISNLLSPLQSHCTPTESPPTPKVPRPPSPKYSLTNLTAKGTFSRDNRQEKDIKQLKMNQNMIWELLSEYGKINSRLENIEKKLDTLISTRKSNNESSSSLPEDLLNFLASVPVGPEQFNQFDELLANNNLFRKELIRILMGVGGRDIKSLAANLLRKTLADEAAEKFSLTGKFRNGLNKDPFVKTKLYLVIQDVCLRKFKPDHAEQKLREAMSDWLMQAKFRRTRRESRKEKHHQEEELNMAVDPD